MTDEEALQAVAIVDRLRQEGARAALALEALEAVLEARGVCLASVGKLLGVPLAVRRWATEQAVILANGTDRQRQICESLRPERLDLSSGVNEKTPSR